MATTDKVGGEVDAFCGRCKMTLAHTILAMVGSKIARVRCNTCGADHAFRGAAAPGGRASVPRAPRPPPAEKVVLTFQDQLAGKDLSQARAYSPKTTYAKGDLITHPQFGYGLVSAVLNDNKIEVSFKGAQRVLVHARSGAPAEKPRFSPPKAAATGPADKAPVEEPAETAHAREIENPGNT
jgi:hypothetical protein